MVKMMQIPVRINSILFLMYSIKDGFHINATIAASVAISTRKALQKLLSQQSFTSIYDFTITAEIG